MTRLTPKHGVAVITGAGTGLGRALALRLTALGFSVVGIGRRSAALEESRALDSTRRFHPLPVDVGRPEQVRAAFDAIERDHGPVALLFNNAAVYPHRDFLNETPESFMATVDSNLGGMVACCHAALLGMARRGQGRIVNVATFADISPLPASSAYAVSKGAARVLTRALVADLGDRFPGIVIGDWMPGMLRTGMGIPDGLDPAQAARWGVELGLRCEPALNGAVFEQDREVPAPRGLKGRIRDLILLRATPAPRQLRPQG